MSGVHATAGTTLHKRLPAVSAPVLAPSGADEDAPAPLPTAEDVLPAAVRTPWPDPAPPATLNRRPRLWQEDTVIALRQAQQHLPDITLAALGWARANDPDFPTSARKRGAELLYRVGDIKKWACNRPRAASGTTDLD